MRFSWTTFITFGITSPDRSIITVSPIRISFRSISSWLWRVAFVTVTPPTSTGSSLATGVTAPVLPTEANMPFIIVVTCCALNFPAIAQRGLLLLAPSSSRRDNELTLITEPSISYGNSFLLVSSFLWKSIAFLIPFTIFTSGFTGSPQFFKHCKN